MKQEEVPLEDTFEPSMLVVLLHMYAQVFFWVHFTTQLFPVFHYVSQ